MGDNPWHEDTCSIDHSVNRNNDPTTFMDYPRSHTYTKKNEKQTESTHPNTKQIWSLTIFFCFPLQTLLDYPMRITLNHCKKSRNVHWKNIAEPRIHRSRYVLVSYYYVCHRYVRSVHKWLNNCSSFDWWERRRSKISYVKWYWMAIRSVGIRTFHYSDRVIPFAIYLYKISIDTQFMLCNTQIERCNQNTTHKNTMIHQVNSSLP